MDFKKNDESEKKLKQKLECILNHMKMKTCITKILGIHLKKISREIYSTKFMY